MANNRKAIRAALKAILVAGNTAAGTNIFTNRSIALSQAELPSINIFTEEEPVEVNAIPLRRYNRSLEMRLELKIQATDDVDDDFDDFAAEVETLILANPDISGTVQGTIQQNTTNITVHTDGDKPMATGTLIFQCKYIS